MIPYLMEKGVTLYQGDALEVLGDFRARSIDLTVTSPPYAADRKGYPSPATYADWFLPIAEQIKRVTKPRGSFVLNIKEGVKGGRRLRYVRDLVDALEDDLGFILVEDYMWHKTTCARGYWPGHFPDAWEHCFHFALEPRRKPKDLDDSEATGWYRDRDAVKVPSPWMEKEGKRRIEKARDYDLTRQHSAAPASNFGRNVSNWGDDAYPTNVLTFSPVASNIGETVFPPDLPEFFIKLLCPKRGKVLDPFLGSGTTAVVAKRLKRNVVGIELNPAHLAKTVERLGS